MSNCCDQKEEVVVLRVKFPFDPYTKPEPIRSNFALKQNVIDFKALAMRNGVTRKIADNKRVTAGIETKRSPLVRLAIPGDIDPLKSPVRSAVYRTLTPGTPSIPGMGAPTRENRGYRCPEGYQYGGRFTDSRLSTCGAKLFDIPSPLGLAISAIRRELRGRAPDKVTGTALGGGQYPESLIDSRKPQIPKVTNDNPNAVAQQAKQLIRDMSMHREKVSRMVRRDGFVLEPVVPPKVLRAIPDNRDMEGATYLMSAFGAPDIGNDELGMLSNTGIKKLLYVMPNGSTISLEKRRPLTVGERRKLGKTVTQAMAQNNSKDPAARLKFLANEMGDGIGYSESFENIKNPNEIINGRPRWSSKVFERIPGSRGRKLEKDSSARETISNAAASKKIDSVDEAIEAIVNGAPLSSISSKIMPEVLSRSRIIQKNKINKDQIMVTVGSEKYLEYIRPNNFQHLGERFASDLQEHIGLASPDIIFSSGPGDKRRYMRQDVEAVVPGSKFNPNMRLKDFKPEDVARMLIADFLSDQRERDLSSVYALDGPSGIVPVLAGNTTSGLTDLSEIKITQRMKMSIGDFYDTDQQINYSEYYKNLKIEQQIAFRNFIDQLLRRATSFKMKELISRLNIDGLSPGEKAHLKIINRIFESRVQILASQKKQLIAMLKGA
jgi:hypothetical protein